MCGLQNDDRDLKKKVTYFKGLRGQSWEVDKVSCLRLDEITQMGVLERLLGLRAEESGSRVSLSCRVEASF